MRASQNAHKCVGKCSCADILKLITNNNNNNILYPYLVTGNVCNTKPRTTYFRFDAGLIDVYEPLDGKPMLTLMYADGPGYMVHRMKDDTYTRRMNLTNFHRM